MRQRIAEEKKREHRPTRKAALSMELSQNVTEKKMAAEAEAASKKKSSEQSSNKGDRKQHAQLRAGRCTGMARACLRR